MAESTIRDLFRNLETVIHEKLKTIEEVIHSSSSSNPKSSNSSLSDLEKRIEQLETISKKENALVVNNIVTQLFAIKQRLDSLEASMKKEVVPTVVSPILPRQPMEGLEIVPKKEVVVPVPTEHTASVVPNSLSLEDRLLLNKKARKALEAEEMGEEGLEDHPEMEETIEESEVGVETEEEVVEEEVVEEEVVEEEVVEEEVVEEEVVEEEVVEEEVVEEEVVEEEVVEEEVVEEEVVEEEVVEEEVVEEEVVEEEVAEEAEEVQLEEFEYKGSTYYRDSDNNVFMVDEDGELIQDPIGVWSEAKKRILVRKPEA